VPYAEQIFGLYIIDILDYADTNKYKTARLFKAVIQMAVVSTLTSVVYG
jgi:hypothetical protein